MGFIAAGIWLLILVWFAFAIPTSLIARRFGHPAWIAYVAWCPFWYGVLAQVWRAMLSELFPFDAIGWLIWFAWLPGAAYLWVLALRKSGSQASRVNYPEGSATG